MIHQDYETMDLCDYAYTMLNQPYIYGKNGAGQWDCSGMVLACLRSVLGFPSIDLRAEDLFNYLKPRKNCQQIFHDYKRNDILFFGSLDHKNHVAIALGPTRMIECGGGDSRCNSIDVATSIGAMVRFKFLNQRKDLVCGIRISEKEDWSF